MRFRPALVPTLVMIPCLVLLVNLGLWQLRRHHEAEERLALVESRLTGPPLGPADLHQPADALAWHEAVLPGRFTGQGPYLVSGRFEFGKPGYGVVEPFRVDGGPTLLVDRGWIPSDDVDATLAAIRTDAPTSVSGLLLPVEGRPDLEPVPAHDGRPEQWRMETEQRLGCETLVGPPFASIARRAGDVADVYLTVGPSLEPGQIKAREPLPVGGYVARPKAIDHLSYAGQWFLIAATMVGVWIYAGVQRGRAA